MMNGLLSNSLHIHLLFIYIVSTIVITTVIIVFISHLYIFRLNGAILESRFGDKQNMRVLSSYGAVRVATKVLIIGVLATSGNCEIGGWITMPTRCSEILHVTMDFGGHA